MRVLMAISVFAFVVSAQTNRTTLSLAISAGCALRDVSTTYTSSTEASNPVITGTTRFTYLLRTSKQGGAAEILLQFPQSPSAPGAALTYHTTLTGAGIPLSGNHLSPSSAVPIAQFSTNLHSTRIGDSGTIEWEWRAPSATPSAPPTLSITCR
jgi:hypothetical protein